MPNLECTVQDIQSLQCTCTCRLRESLEFMNLLEEWSGGVSAPACTGALWEDVFTVCKNQRTEASRVSAPGAVLESVKLYREIESTRVSAQVAPDPLRDNASFN